MNLLAVEPLRTGGTIRWIARILGLLSALFVLAWDIGGVVAILTERTVELPHVLEAIVLSWAAGTLVLAWRWEKLGGLLGVLTGVALGVVILLTAEPERAIYLLFVLSLPLITIGGAFLIADREPRALQRKSRA